MALPTRCYLVCGSQRSGTTLLCRALADTGIAGRPAEYFLAVSDEEFPGGKYWEEGPFGVANGATDRGSYLRVVYQLGSTPNGVFGAKLMWNNLRWAVAKFQEMETFAGLSRNETLRAAFPNLQIVDVTRRDRIRQAVSWARMAQEGVWVVSDDEPTVPSGKSQYDFQFIHALAKLIIEGEEGWRALYDEIGLEPFEVVCEEFVSQDGYERTIRGVLEHLGVAAADTYIPPPRTHRQSDELSEEWVERYEADRLQIVE